MKKILVTTFAALAALAMVTPSVASCARNAGRGDGPVTDSIGFEKKDKFVECSIAVDAPVQGNETLCNIIREFISDELGGTYRGSYSNMDSVLAHYGRQRYDELYDMAKDMEGSFGLPYFYGASIRKIYETDKLVTYQTVISEYLGGAHPFTYAEAATFRKSDGRRFGRDIFNASFNERSSEILSDGLKKYFEVKTDEELKACLLNMDEYAIIPMPQCAPYFTKDGIVLSYGQYEIAPYAAGMPEVTIPYDKARELLKVSALEVME